MNNDQRYKVDERSGCAAIIDTYFPNETQCLDSFAVGVTHYENLPREENKERACKLNTLNELCEKLNKTNNVNREVCEEVFKEFAEVKIKLKILFPRIFDIRIH